MTTLVSINCKNGALRRYECGGAHPRRTHVATPEDGPLVLTAAMIEKFRVDPPEAFAEEPIDGS